MYMVAGPPSICGVGSISCLEFTRAALTNLRVCDAGMYVYPRSGVCLSVRARCTYTCVYMYIHTSKLRVCDAGMYLHPSTDVCIHTYIHTCMHAYIHTYTSCIPCICIYIACKVCCGKNARTHINTHAHTHLSAGDIWPHVVC